MSCTILIFCFRTIWLGFARRHLVHWLWETRLCTAGCEGNQDHLKYLTLYMCIVCAKACQTPVFEARCSKTTQESRTTDNQSPSKSINSDLDFYLVTCVRPTKGILGQVMGQVVGQVMGQVKAAASPSPSASASASPSSSPSTNTPKKMHPHLHPPCTCARAAFRSQP
jgi:hypothetical protein